MAARSKIVGLLFGAWDDLDRALADLTPEEAVRPDDGGSSFAWTLAHVTNTVDALINVRFRRLAPHPLLGQERFRRGGDGRADDWPALQAAVAEVRATARRYLQDLTEADLELVVPYDGSLAFLRPTGLPLRYAVLRNVAHHYTHLGEIVAKRERLGHRAGDFPGQLLEAL